MIRKMITMKTQLDPLERVGVPACVANELGRIVCWNQFATDFFGLTADVALGGEWHSVVCTVETPGCCALCRTRRSLRNDEPVSPVDVLLSIRGRYQRAVMVPIPVSTTHDVGIGFLILARETSGASASELQPPIPIRSRVRRLEDDRIIDELTAREREIMACIVNGFDARAIASQLSISHATARNHVQRILNKLGARNKAEAVNLVLTYNLLAS